MSEQQKRFARARRFVRAAAPAVGFIGVGALLANLSLVAPVVKRGYDFLRGAPRTGAIELTLYDGTRQPLPQGMQVLVRVFDGNQKEVLARYLPAPRIKIDGLKFFDNFGDNYTVIAWVNGYKQAGFHPVKIKRGETVPVSLMLMADPARFDFSGAAWSNLQAISPSLFALLSSGATPQEAKGRYEALMANQPGALAHLLNVAAALSGITLPDGASVLPYYRRLVWDSSMRQDNIWGYADARLVDQLKKAVAAGTFEYAAGSMVFHPGNTGSFKERSFYEANVQITFYENDRKVIDGVDCVKVETDIDYYRDPAAHIILEVLPNTVAGRITDPAQVYQLRWIAARQKGSVPFEPPYTIVKNGQ